MARTSFYMDLIAGKRRGLLPTLCRGLLRCMSAVYGRVVRLRNAYYNWWGWPSWLDVPVISVGNLTVGGTGKTPMTLWLCERLLERGLTPAVLSRGYKADEAGVADELLMLSRRCRRAVAVAHKNRAAAGRLAIEQYNVQVAVLDDGFQHRQVGRDMDIVLIDATRPFGYGHILPRGLLREPVEGLWRADAVVITRCDQCEPHELDALEAEIRQLQPEAPIVRAVHRPGGVVDLKGNEVTLPEGARVGCFAGIARPEAFERTLRDMQLGPTDTRWWPDHHVYTEVDLQSLDAWAQQAGLDYLVTTEKDAVKLTAIERAWPIPVAALRVDIDMLDDGDKILCNAIDAMLRQHEENNEPNAEQPQSD